MSSFAPPISEAIEAFDCFGGTCSVLVQGWGPAGSAPEATARVRRRLLEWHAQFSRFEPSSELCRLNRDPRECVPASPMMTRFVEAALHAAEITGGLVDPTLVSEVEQAGYAADFVRRPLSLADALRLAPARRPAAPSPAARWRPVHVDRGMGTVRRPPGVRRWLLGLVHTFTTGTDAGNLWFVALIGLTAAPVLVLLLVRLGRRRLPASRTVSPAGAQG
jgi:ApbE family protein